MAGVQPPFTPGNDDRRALKRTNAALLRLGEVREAEARRIAQALHDEAGQLVASVHLALEELAREQGITSERLEPLRARLDAIEQRLRTLSHELRPPVLDDFGLTAAVEALVQGVAGRSGLKITVESSIGRRLPATIETAVYRIVQEALRNAVRHAHARSVSVRLCERAGQLKCSVSDDGVGFHPPAGKHPRGLGLVGIRERVQSLNGSVRVSSRASRGTEVFVRIPVGQAASPVQSKAASAAGRAGNRNGERTPGRS